MPAKYYWIRSKPPASSAQAADESSEPRGESPKTSSEFAVRDYVNMTLAYHTCQENAEAAAAYYLTRWPDAPVASPEIIKAVDQHFQKWGCSVVDHGDEFHMMQRRRHGESSKKRRLDDKN